MGNVKILLQIRCEDTFTPGGLRVADNASHRTRYSRPVARNYSFVQRLFSVNYMRLFALVGCVAEADDIERLGRGLVV